MKLIKCVLMIMNRCETTCSKIFLTALEWFALGSSTTGIIVEILYQFLYDKRDVPQFLNLSLSDWNSYFAFQNATTTCICATLVSILLYCVAYDYDEPLTICCCKFNIKITQAVVFILTIIGGIFNYLGYYFLKQHNDNASLNLILTGCIIQIIMSKVYRWLFYTIMFEHDRQFNPIIT
jgi:hypothetical protein